MTVAISKAAEDGAKAVICASTGNTSASAAAYAVRAGMTCAVLVPQGKIALGKMAQALVHGAKLLQVDGNFDDCLELAQKLSVDYPVALVNSVNPYRLEGQKTAAFEICERLGRAPDVHCIPGRQRGQHHGVLEGLCRVRRGRRRRLHAAHVRLPGRGCRADRQRRAGEVAGDDRDRDPDRQPRLLGSRRAGARRVRRSHRRGDRQADPRGVPAVRSQRGGVRRAGVGGERRRAAADRGGRSAARRIACRVHGDRQRAQGSRSGRSPAPRSRSPSRSTAMPPRPHCISHDRGAGTGARARHERESRARLRCARPRARTARRGHGADHRRRTCRWTSSARAPRTCPATNRTSSCARCTPPSTNSARSRPGIALHCVERDSARARARLVRGGDRRRRPRGARPGRRAVPTRCRMRTCCASRPGSRDIPTTSPRACSAG